MLFRSDWPALASAPTGSRKAWIEVFDARGKRVHRLDLGAVRVGRQIVAVDASAWEPGIYSYRLSVLSVGSRAHFQKRMLVTR